jgi:hypothetical protein
LHRIDKIGHPLSVKHWRYFVAVVLCLVIIYYVYIHRQDLGLVRPHAEVISDSSAPRSDSTEPAAVPALRVGSFNWRAVNRASEGFRVEMPADVRKTQVPAYNDRGGSEEISMIIANPDADSSYSVSWADDPPVIRNSDHTADHILEIAKQGALARTQTTQVTETRTNPGGNPGRDFVGRNAGGGGISARLICAGRRLYMLTATFPSDSARRDQDIARFFNSFSITGASAASSIPESLPPASTPGERR